MTHTATARIGIFHPSDPAGHIPSGIDTVIRGILRWAPEDLDYTLFGATSDPVARPVGRSVQMTLGGRPITYWPLVVAPATSRRLLVPLTLRYLAALTMRRSDHVVRRLHVLDFHRLEPLALFRRDPRPKNVLLHTDMTALRHPLSDIRWRHAPWAYEFLERKVLPAASSVLCVRRSAVTRYAQTLPHIASRFAFLPTWVETETFRPLDDAARHIDRQRSLAQLGVATDSSVLIWVGRIDRQKNPMLLLDALKRLTTDASALPSRRVAHLLMIGDGSMRSQVVSQIERLGLTPQITLLGALSPEQIAGWLRIADLFVLPSSYEGMPIALLEALATGLPVVVTDVGEVRLVVRDGVNGFISTAQTADAFADACKAALRSIDALRGGACLRAVAPYTPERVLTQVYENHRRQAADVMGARA